MPTKKSTSKPAAKKSKRLQKGKVLQPTKPLAVNAYAIVGGRPGPLTSKAGAISTLSS